MSRIQVLHVVPSLNIGGVEVGLLRSHSELQKSITFQVFSVKGPGRLKLPSLSWVEAMKLIIRKQERPQVVVTSLWLGHTVGFLLAAIYGVRWIPFFHSARSEGVWRDAILRGAASLSQFAFFDSVATLQYFGTHDSSRSQIIPYRFVSPNRDTEFDDGRYFTCIFVGRLSPEKRPDLLIEYLVHLQRLLPDFRALVLAAGEKDVQDDFSALLQSKGVVADVRANVPPLTVVDLLCQSALYLSFSDYEGFGMATVDAMSCGCIPVVRPVGEIASYVDEGCGILVNDTSPEGISAVVEQSVALLKDADSLRTFSKRSRLNVSRYSLYTESYLEGVQRALALT